MDLDEMGSPLQIVMLSVTQPVQKTMVWQVLQEEDGGNRDSLADGKEIGLKVENPLFGENEPEDTPRTPQQTSHGNVLETAERKEKGGESKGHQWKQPVERENEHGELTEGLPAPKDQPSDVHSRAKMPLFSKYGRRYRYRPELVMMHVSEDHSECFTSEENVQQTSYFDEYQRTVTGQKQNMFPEDGKGCYLVRHQSHDTEEKPNNSPDCGNYAKSVKGTQEIQAERRPYKSSQCGKCFSERIHNGKLHGCLECGKCFSHRRDLERHQRIHTGEKPYKCLECGKCFHQKGNMSRHQRTHTGEKPHTCSQCGKRFKQRMDLERHQRIHTGEKPYECPECGKCFNWGDTLRSHQRIHT
ncbi:zinc finger protein 629-like [Rhineura floridana]|uniref:zinc finger protein 629-like n=1 Tax=Rhineura floridana TaxID=261503 RepID=UPI002AC7F6AB|nr:zinc finger protein 629-like [Rhineura floridana]XP_061476137.1 zinc finger protein 629-like [Rhineura floridana]XP_061476138.1 zinc finger protein 629-like [Rhineura floridana]XP_061476140.1 zinc finger protein 629-like [Rhineura floridana]XP_061476141.1 zinc finger protein 629-like [Rhineura floridana]XP_061476142.1 zinc finger protein 629-like [Rhineura floridana]